MFANATFFSQNRCLTFLDSLCSQTSTDSTGISRRCGLYVDPVVLYVGGIGLAINEDAMVSAYHIRAFEKRHDARAGVQRLKLVGVVCGRLYTRAALPKPAPFGSTQLIQFELMATGRSHASSF
jgi:hypothetical protein